ncbi:hypothetical protein HKX48_000353 [Thoreauomyces humboldtii]|nr:hypothetical protein HKX48_000353 [Thoreauomyces humboldtii]
MAGARASLKVGGENVLAASGQLVTLLPVAGSPLPPTLESEEHDDLDDFYTEDLEDLPASDDFDFDIPDSPLERIEAEATHHVKLKRMRSRGVLLGGTGEAPLLAKFDGAALVPPLPPYVSASASAHDPSFATLPANILHRIASYLPYDQAANLLRISRRLQQAAAAACYAAPRLTSAYRLHGLLGTLRRTLHAGRVPYAAFVHTLMIPAHVASEVLVGDLDALLQQIPNLREFTLEGGEGASNVLLQSLADNAPRLRKLNLSRAPVTDAMLPSLVRSCPELEFVDLAYSHVTIASLAVLLGGCPRITSINLDGCGASVCGADSSHESDEDSEDGSMGGSQNPFAFVSNPQLTVVTLRKSAATDRHIRILARRAPNLQKAILSGCVALTDESVLALARRCGRSDALHELDLSGCSEISDLGLRALGMLAPALVTLHVSGCPRIGYPGVRALAAANTNLRFMAVDSWARGLGLPTREAEVASVGRNASSGPYVLDATALVAIAQSDPTKLVRKPSTTEAGTQTPDDQEVDDYFSYRRDSTSCITPPPRSAARHSTSSTSSSAYNGSSNRATTPPPPRTPQSRLPTPVARSRLRPPTPIALPQPTQLPAALMRRTTASRPVSQSASSPSPVPSSHKPRALRRFVSDPVASPEPGSHPPRPPTSTTPVPARLRPPSRTNSQSQQTILPTPTPTPPPVRPPTTHRTSLQWSHPLRPTTDAGGWITGGSIAGEDNDYDEAGSGAASDDDDVRSVVSNVASAARRGTLTGRKMPVAMRKAHSGV